MRLGRLEDYPTDCRLPVRRHQHGHRFLPVSVGRARDAAYRGGTRRTGANLGHICQEIYQSFPITRVRLLRHVYSTFRLTHDGKTAYFWLKKANYSRAGASVEESEGLIDHIRAIEGVLVAVVFEETESEITRISLRSKTADVNVNEIANLFGGGGHKAAAGARVSGSPLSAQRRVLGAIKRSLAGKPLK